MKKKKISLPTILGLLAILLWSTTIAFSRDLIGRMGVLNFAFYLLFFSGVFLLILQFIKLKKKMYINLRNIPFGYFYKVGTFLILYMITFYLALGEADSTEAVLVVGLLNYLWPSFALILSIPILNNKVKKGILLAGILFALFGTFLAVISQSELNLNDMTQTLKTNIIPYLLAFLAAVFWGAYSNLTRKHQVLGDQVALPVLFLMSALVILVITLLKGSLPIFNLALSQFFKFAYIVIFPTSLSYLFWDKAMKKGNKNLILSIAYLIPLFSTLITILYFKVKLTLIVVLAAILIIFGAVFCRMSLIIKKIFFGQE